MSCPSLAIAPGKKTYRLVNDSRILGITAGVTGILLFSSKAVMVKLAYGYEVDTVSLLLLRMIFALPFYVVIALLNKPQSKVSAKNYMWLVILGIIGYYLASYFDFLGLQYIKASLERLILFVYPTLVLLISYIVFKKKITRKQALGVLTTYLGIVIIFGAELQIEGQDKVVLGSLLIFLSALTYASYLVGSGWLIPKFGSTVFTAYAMIVSCVSVIVHYALSHPVGLFDFPPEVYWIGFAMGVIATVIPSFLISFAIKNLGANNFSIFGSLGPVSTIVLAYIFLEERLTILQLLGAFVILFGIYVAERKQLKPK